MPLGEEVELSLTAGSPVYEFSGKPQGFAAFKVPDELSATAIQVRTYLQGVFVWNMSAVLPQFTFLDETHRAITTRVTENFQHTTGFWRSAVAGRVTVPEGARYFVVTAGDGMSGVPVIHSGNGTAHRVNPAATGNFSLRIFGEPRR